MAFSLCFLVLVHLIWIFNIQFVNGQGPIHNIRIHQGLNCSGKILAEANDDYDWHSHFGQVDNASISVNGAWVFTQNVDGTPYPFYGMSDPGSYQCIDIEHYGAEIHLEAHGIGHPDQAVPTLHISYGGEPCCDFHYINSTGSRSFLQDFSEERSTVQYWFFSGSQEWGLYEGVNYTGKVTCLTPRAEVRSKGFGFTYSFEPDNEIIVRSAKVGCTQDDFDVGTTENSLTTLSTTETNPSGGGNGSRINNINVHINLQILR